MGANHRALEPFALRIATAMHRWDSGSLNHFGLPREEDAGFRIRLSSVRVAPGRPSREVPPKLRSVSAGQTGVRDAHARTADHHLLPMAERKNALVF